MPLSPATGLDVPIPTLESNTAVLVTSNVPGTSTLLVNSTPVPAASV